MEITMTTAGKYSYYADFTLEATGDVGGDDSAVLTHNLYAKDPTLSSARHIISVINRDANVPQYEVSVIGNNSVTIVNHAAGTSHLRVFVQGIHSINL